MAWFVSVCGLGSFWFPFKANPEGSRNMPHVLERPRAMGFWETIHCHSERLFQSPYGRWGIWGKLTIEHTTCVVQKIFSLIHIGLSQNKGSPKMGGFPLVSIQNHPKRYPQQDTPIYIYTYYTRYFLVFMWFAAFACHSRQDIADFGAGRLFFGCFLFGNCRYEQLSKFAGSALGQSSLGK